MAQCPKCYQEIEDGAVICKYCNAIFEVPSRPTGVLVISIWLFAQAFFGLISIFSIKEYNSYFLFLNVPVSFRIIEGLISMVLSVYCGYGMLKQRNMARNIYKYWLYYGILSGFCSLFFVNKIMNNVMPGASDMIASIATAFSYIGILFGIGLNIFIVSYLEKKKDYFVN
jgi:hypothetical protein